MQFVVVLAALQLSCLSLSGHCEVRLDVDTGGTNHNRSIHRLAVALQVGRQTSNREVVGSTPAQAVSYNNFRQTVHTVCASVIKQYNLVIANGQSCSHAGKVTAGLVESNDSLPLGL